MPATSANLCHPELRAGVEDDRNCFADDKPLSRPTGDLVLIAPWVGVRYNCHPINNFAIVRCFWSRFHAECAKEEGAQQKERGAQQAAEAAGCDKCRELRGTLPHRCHWRFSRRAGSVQQSPSITSRRAWARVDIHPTSGPDARERHG